MRRLLALLALILLPAAALAECQGQDLIAALPAQARADLRAAADSYPFARGNLWQARKGSQVIHLVGTYHFDDPRHDATLGVLAPLLAEATALLVEAGPEEEAALKARMASDPSAMLITTGPTLPEALAPADWSRLKEAMGARGIPGFVAAKFRPWYISMMLSIPPCAMAEAATSRGLDGQLIDLASARGVPVRALEPFDTVLGIFDTLTPQDQIDMITTALASEDRADDMAATLADGYFAGDSRLIWEFNRLVALEEPGASPEKVAADMAEMDRALMANRNRRWIPVIEAAAGQGPALVAFGALHLSGEAGVLNLLAQDGWHLTRLPLPGEVP